jgi:hypothetical protein
MFQYKRYLLRGLFCGIACMAAAPLSAQGTFTTTSPLTTQRYLSPFVRLQDGRIFTAGGRFMSNGTTQSTSSTVLASTEIYDPATGVSSAAASLTQARGSPAIAALNDGRAVVLGGESSTSTVVDKIEIYDPTTNTFSLAGYTPAVRIGATAVTLLDGRVMVVGGTVASGAIVNTIWIYTFGPQGAIRAQVSMSTRTGCTLTRMNDGRVLIAGGHPSNGTALATLEIFDPTTNTIAAGPNMSSPRIDHAATLMADGRVFICGGRSVSDSVTTATKTCDIFDPASGTITTFSMNTARSEHWVALLDTGKILINAAEVFDPSNSTFTFASSGMNQNRKAAAAIKLFDGRIFVGGGVSIPGTTILLSTELFSPTGWSPNQLPIANAGPDQIIYTGSASQTSVTLNGSSSSDPEGLPLTHTWEGNFGTASGVSPIVTLPVGIHVVELSVTDSANQTTTNTVAVAVVQGADQTSYAALQSQIQTLNTQITTLLAELQTANATIATLTADKQALQTQLNAANAQIATLTTQINDLTATNLQLTQKNASLVSLLQSLLQGFDQIKALAASINTVSDEKKQAINQALSGN